MNDLLETVPLNHFKCTLIAAQLVIMSGFMTSFEPQDNYFLLVYHNSPPSSPDRVFRLWTMTNMSSMPIPSSRKGITAWAAE